MGSFPPSYNSLYILLAVDYVSKWVEAIPTHTKDAKVVAQFLHSHIFSRFGIPRALIKNNGTHFYNKMIDKVLQKYGVRHRTSLAYHHSQMGKQRYQIEKLSPLWRKQLTVLGRIGLKRLKMHSRHTEQHLKHPSVCRLLELFMAKHAIFQWNWSIEPTGQLGN